MVGLARQEALAESVSLKSNDGGLAKLFSEVPGLKSLWDKANALHESKFEPLVLAVAGRVMGRRKEILFADPKNPGTAWLKAIRKYDGDITKVGDILRATVYLQTENDLARAATVLQAAVEGQISFKDFPDVEAYGYKNSFSSNTHGGLGMIKANFIIDGVRTEIMFRFKCKHEQQLALSHHRYERVRAIDTALGAQAENIAAARAPEEYASLCRVLERRRRREQARRERHNEKALA